MIDCQNFIGEQADSQSYQQCKALGSTNQDHDCSEKRVALSMTTAGNLRENSKPYITVKGYVALGPIVLRDYHLISVIFGCIIPIVP
jgi:hypothetical protein